VLCLQVSRWHVFADWFTALTLPGFIIARQNGRILSLDVAISSSKSLQCPG
jgi:hypothetical protein